MAIKIEHFLLPVREGNGCAPHIAYSPHGVFYTVCLTLKRTNISITNKN